MPKNNNNRGISEKETKGTPHGATADHTQKSITTEPAHANNDDSATCAITLETLTEEMGPIVLCNATRPNRGPALADSVQALKQRYSSISEVSGEAAFEFFRHKNWKPARDLNNVFLDQTATVRPHPAFNNSSSSATISHYLSTALLQRQEPYPGVTLQQLLKQSQAALDYMKEQDSARSNNQGCMRPVEYKILSLMLQICNAFIGAIALTLSTSSRESIIPIIQKAYAIASFDGNCHSDDDDWADSYYFGRLISTTSPTALFIASAFFFMFGMLPSLYGPCDSLDSRPWPGAINSIKTFVLNFVMPCVVMTGLLFFSNLILDSSGVTASINYESPLKRNGQWEGNNAKGYMEYIGSYTPGLDGWLNAQKSDCISNDFTLTANEYKSIVAWATPTGIATCDIEAFNTWQESFNTLRFIICYGFGVILPAIIGTLFYAFNTGKRSEQDVASRINFFQQQRARSSSLEVRVDPPPARLECQDIVDNSPRQPLLSRPHRLHMR